MKLILNGGEIELKDSQITINKSAFDPDNPTIRRIDYSGDIRIPFTNTNHKIMQSAYNISGKNKEFKQFVPATIKDDNTLSIGKALYKGIRNQHYIVQVVDKSKELYDYLNQELKEFDFSSEDFELSAANIQARNELDYLIGFPMVFMDTSVNRMYRYDVANYQYARPVLLFKKVFDKLFADKNYSYSYQDDMIEFLACSMNHEKLYVTSYIKDFTGDTFSSSQLLNMLTTDFYYNVTLYLNSIDTSTIPTIYRIKGDVTLTDNCVIRIEEVAGDQLQQEFYINKNQTTVDFQSNEFTGEVRIRIIPDDSITFDSVRVYTLVEGENISNDYEDYYFIVRDNMPDLTAMDLLRTYFLLTNSIIESDVLSNELKFVKNIKGEVKDWSDKYIEDSEEIEEITPFYQTTKLKYDNDEYVNLFEGEHQFSINDKRIGQSGDMITLPFSASNENNDYSQVITMCDVPIYDSSVRINTVSPRLFYLEYRFGQRVARFNYISFNELATNYADLIKSHQDYALLEARFNLTKHDVIGWKPTNVVYIKKFQSLFSVVEISNFVKGKSTEVTLIRR